MLLSLFLSLQGRAHLRGLSPISLSIYAMSDVEVLDPTDGKVEGDHAVPLKVLFAPGILVEKNEVFEEMIVETTYPRSYPNHY